MFVIHASSDAFAELARAAADPDTYKISIEHHPSRPYRYEGTTPTAFTGESIAVKVNEAMWSPPLSIARRMS